MKKPVAGIELPAGECKSTKSYKSFTGGESEVAISFRTEERRLGSTVICEKEKTRVSCCKDGISVLCVNLIYENGITKKVMEYGAAYKNGEKTDVVRRRKMLKNGQLIGDFSVCETKDKEYLDEFEKEARTKQALYLSARENSVTRNIFKG